MYIISLLFFLIPHFFSLFSNHILSIQLWFPPSLPQHNTSFLTSSNPTFFHFFLKFPHPKTGHFTRSSGSTVVLDEKCFEIFFWVQILTSKLFFWPQLFETWKKVFSKKNFRFKLFFSRKKLRFMLNECRIWNPDNKSFDLSPIMPSLTHFWVLTYRHATQPRRVGRVWKWS